MNMRRTLRMLRARYRARALIAKLNDETNTIASAQALKEGGRIMGDLSDVNVLLRVMTMMRAHGIEIPNEAETISWLKTRERELKVAKHEIIAKVVATVTARLGVTPDDAKAVRSRRETLKRNARKANGDCVRCPNENVRRAAPGSTTCDECGEKHRTQGGEYRQRRKAHERAS